MNKMGKKKGRPTIAIVPKYKRGIFTIDLNELQRH